nr:unnamed protein product [Callosobruchus analis]
MRSRTARHHLSI